MSYTILTPELGQLNQKPWEPQAGDLVAFKDYQGETFPGRLARIAADGTMLVKGIGLETHKYWGVTIPINPEQVWPAI